MKKEILLRCNLLSGFPLVVVCLWAVFTQSKVLEERQKLLQSPNYTQVLPYSFFHNTKVSGFLGKFCNFNDFTKSFQRKSFKSNKFFINSKFFTFHHHF